MLKTVTSRLSLKEIDSKKTFFNLLTLAIIITVSILRILAYGNPNLSIATNDTVSYIKSSQVPLFSSEIMTGRRLLSTNVLYKIFEPKNGYEILVNGSGDTTRRLLQPGFDRIVIFQLTLSILGWGFLAWTISQHLENSCMKLLATITILLFAFTPQITDWDSILMSESLVFSLFALQLAILIKLSFLVFKDNKKEAFFYSIIWVIVFFWWTFLRDTNLFVSLVTAGMISFLLLFTKYKKNKDLIKVLVFVMAIFFLGLFTSANSTRSLIQIANIYSSDLLRSPTSVETLVELGMPTPGTEAYETWFQKNSSKTLIKFMVTHPGYPILKIIRDFPIAFTEIKQIYFKAPEQFQARQMLMTIGEALHPENTTPFLLDVFLLAGVTILAITNRNETSKPWAWLGFWLFMIASFTLIPTILGDSWALSRHALFSTTIYRLFMWMFSIIIMDIAIGQNQTRQTTNSQIQ